MVEIEVAVKELEHELKKIPHIEVHVENYGLKTAFGSSGYISARLLELEENYQKRHNEWVAKGAKSNRGPEPRRKYFHANYRISDHDVGVRRAAQHILLAASSDMKKEADKIRTIDWNAPSKINWTSRA